MSQPQTDQASPHPEDAEVPGVGQPVSPKRRRPGDVLLRGTALQGVSQLVPLVVNLALTPYIIAGLGPRIYAIFLLVSVIQSFMATVDGGIGPSASRWFTVYAGAGDEAAATRLLTTLLAIIAGITVVAFGAFFVLAPRVLGFFPVTANDPHGSVFFLRTMVVLVAANQLRGLFAYVLFAHHRFGVTTAMNLLGYLIYVVGLVWTIERGHGLVGIAIMFVVQQVVATVFIVPSACRFLTPRGIGLVPRETLSEFFAYSWKAQLSSLLDVAALYGDMLVVQRFRPQHAAGFGPGSTFAQQLRMVPLNAYSPIQSAVGRAVGAEGEQGALATFERIQRPWVLAVTGWVAVGAPAAYFGVNAWLHAALASDLGEQAWLPGAVAAVLTTGNLFWLLSTVQVIWCLSVGRSDIELRYGLVSLVLNLAATVALIIPFGVLGSVLATAVAQLVASLVLVVLVRRRLAVVPRSPFSLLPWGPAAVAACLSAAGTWATSRLVPGAVPYGAAGLVVTGLGAVPALVVYAAWTFGLGRVRDLVATRVSALRR